MPAWMGGFFDLVVFLRRKLNEGNFIFPLRPPIRFFLVLRRVEADFRRAAAAFFCRVDFFLGFRVAISVISI